MYLWLRSEYAYQECSVLVYNTIIMAAVGEGRESQTSCHYILHSTVIMELISTPTPPTEYQSKL